MRGRYMGIFSMVWTVAFGIGPLAGGAIIDRFEDRLVWVAACAIELVAIAGFLALDRALRARRRPVST
jgi:MFS family permease